MSSVAALGPNGDWNLCLSCACGTAVTYYDRYAGFAQGVAPNALQQGGASPTEHEREAARQHWTGAVPPPLPVAKSSLQAVVLKFAAALDDLLALTTCHQQSAPQEVGEIQQGDEQMFLLLRELAPVEPAESPAEALEPATPGGAEVLVDPWQIGPDPWCSPQVPGESAGGSRRRRRRGRRKPRSQRKRRGDGDAPGKVACENPARREAAERRTAQARSERTTAGLRDLGGETVEWRAAGPKTNLWEKALVTQKLSVEVYEASLRSAVVAAPAPLDAGKEASSHNTEHNDALDTLAAVEAPSFERGVVEAACVETAFEDEAASVDSVARVPSVETDFPCESEPCGDDVASEKPAGDKGAPAELGDVEAALVERAEVAPAKPPPKQKTKRATKMRAEKA